MNLRVLLIEDSPDDAALLLRHLRGAGIEPQPERVDTEAALREALAREPWQLALVDYNLPGFGGPQALALLADLAPDLPAITVSGAISEETAVTTLNAGAVDYVLKGNLTRLAPAVLRAVEGAELRREQRRAVEQARQTQFAIEHSSQAIAYVSRDGTILYGNAAAHALGDVPSGAAIGQKMWAWIPMVDEQGWAELWQVATRHPVVDFEATVRLSGGGERLVSTSLEYHEREGESFVIVYARDITEQRGVEERAAESEARYGRLTDNAPDIIFRYDFTPTMGLTYINPAVEAITGYTPQDCYADPQLMLTMVHPDDAPLMADMLQSLSPPDEPLLMRWIGKDGVLRWMESRIVPVRDAQGRLLAVEGITRDVTERRQAEAALAHSRDLMRYVIEHAQSAVAVHDRDLNYIYVSQRYLKDYGVKAHDVLGKGHYEVFPDLPQKWRDAHQKALAGEISSADDDPYVREDGSIDWTRWECRPWYEADGSIGGIIVYTEVITARKRVEEALRQSEERFRRVSEATADFAYTCVRRPGGACSFEWLTGAVERCTGWSREELLERGCWKSLVIDEDVPLFEERVTGLGPEGSGVCELRIRDKQGDVRWLAVYSEAEQEATNPAVHRLHGACQDITERKQAEEALRESEERFEEFAGHLPGYLFMHDEDGRYVYVNRREQMDGEVPREDWFGKTPAEIWDGDPGMEEEARVKRALEGEVVDEVVSWTPSGLNEYLHSIYFRIPRDGKPPLVGGLSLDISEQHKAEDQIRRQAEQLSRTVEGAVLAMSNVVETRDPYTAGHERRVSELATALAKDMGLEGEQLEALRLAALIHDIGKIAVPAEILAKPGRLSEVEFNLIKQHPQSGFEILGVIDFGSPVAEMVLQHHERLDGSGYPRALSGEAVMTEARILAVADVVEAMSSHRPYRPALGMEAALAEIRGGAGEKYDPEVVSACARLFEEQGFAFTL